MEDLEWVRKSELASLLRACRSRIPRPVPGGRGNGLRQEDVASLVGLSRRRYADLERGEFVPLAAVVDKVAKALRMTDAERSALHVLATGQDPPRLTAGPSEVVRREPSPDIRQLVNQIPHPACLTDELRMILHYNELLDVATGGWCSRQQPSARNLTLYLFSDGAPEVLPDLPSLQQMAIAALRYQYDRNLAYPGAADLVARFLAAPAAAELWARHEVNIPPHQYLVRVRHRMQGIIEGRVIFAPIDPTLWLYVRILPTTFRAPA
jgi:transcriptional regulator with XRE-family HTH domain